jgi:hypothetical protein
VRLIGNDRCAIPESYGNEFNIKTVTSHGTYTVAVGFLLYDNQIELITDNATIDKTIQNVCSCGAKHTSNVNYHLGYCDLRSK